MEPCEVIIDERELEALQRDIAALIEAGERKLQASTSPEPPAAEPATTDGAARSESADKPGAAPGVDQEVVTHDLREGSMAEVSTVETDQVSVSSSAPGFAPVALRLLADERIMDPETISVFAALASFIDYGSGNCFPTHAAIAKRARCDESTVKRRIDSLVRLGYVRKVSGKASGKPNRYHLSDPWGRNGGSARESYPSVPGELPGSARESYKRDSLNETQKQKERESAQRASPEVPMPGETPKDPPPVSLTEEVKKLAKEEGVPTTFMTPAWLADLRKLREQVSGESIIKAFRVCLQNDPEKARFFAGGEGDYSRWLKIANDADIRAEKAAHSGPVHPVIQGMVSKLAGQPAEEDSPPDIEAAAAGKHFCPGCGKDAAHEIVSNYQSCGCGFDYGMKARDYFARQPSAQEATA